MNNSDTTSFQSILENARKFQELKKTDDHIEKPHIQKQQAQRENQPTPSRGGQIVNSFNKNGNSRTSLAGQTSNYTPNSKSKASSNKVILVNRSQKGNPLLDKLVNVNWRYVSPSSPLEKIDYDYMVMEKRKVIFLSLKYHKLHPEYIMKKIKPVINQNCVMLCVVDIENSENILKDINKICMFNGFTLLLSFQFEQAAKYLMYMNNP